MHGEDGKRMTAVDFVGIDRNGREVAIFQWAPILVLWLVATPPSSRFNHRESMVTARLLT